jgi:putative endonuclease
VGISSGEEPLADNRSVVMAKGFFRDIMAGVHRVFHPTVGVKGERVAAKHLRRAGYRILGRNLRNRFGEVDILAEAPDRRTVVIVEVKSATVGERTHSGARFFPEVHVDFRKRKKLAMLAGQMVRRYKLADRPVRFDVVGVDIGVGGSVEVRHHVGAFESPS